MNNIDPRVAWKVAQVSINELLEAETILDDVLDHPVEYRSEAKELRKALTSIRFARIILQCLTRKE